MKARRPGPAKPFSIAVSALAATVICGFSPWCSQLGHAYFLHMLEAFEVSRNVFDLPTLLAADLLALHTTARAGQLFWAQLVYVGVDGETLEVRQRTPPLAAFDPP